jgi:hypothetical protein
MARPQAALSPVERIVNRIYLILGEKVMLDSDLAELYGVETRILVQAVKRNSDRFPDDFMFQFSEELENWRSQIVMSNPAAKMGLRRRPYAFTELGVAMLSTVLRSKSALHSPPFSSYQDEGGSSAGSAAVKGAVWGVRSIHP